MIKIAIIDGDITSEELRYPERIAMKKYIRHCEDNVDTCHALLIAKILELLADNYLLYNYVVLNGDNSTNISLLIQALDCAFSDGVSIVSMSIGTIIPSDAVRLYPHICKLINCGVIVVAAQSNSGQWTFPAAFPGVIGVQRDFLNVLSPFQICTHADHPLQIDITANCCSCIDATPIPNRNSYAVPVVVAAICNAQFPFSSTLISQLNSLANNKYSHVYESYITKHTNNVAYPRPCRVCLCEASDSEYANNLLIELNMTHRVSTIGISGKRTISGACWYQKSTIRSFATQVNLIESNSLLELSLIAINNSELPDILYAPLEIDLTIIICSDCTFWIIDKDTVNPIVRSLGNVSQLATQICTCLS